MLRIGNLSNTARRLISLHLAVTCLMSYGALPAFGQGQGRPTQFPGKAQSTSGRDSFAGQTSTVNVRDIVRQQAERAAAPETETTPTEPREEHAPLPMPENRVLPPGFSVPESVKQQAQSRTDEAAPVGPLAKSSPAPTPLPPSPPANPSFLALLDNLNLAGGPIIPPDTEGAVGPRHIMTALNSEIRFQRRDGSEIFTIPTANFWLGFNLGEVFDPHVLYDYDQQRWMFTMFADPFSSSSSVLLAVSQTQDPTGVWNLYRVLADEQGANFADFPSIGYNRNWITITANMFSNSSGLFQESRIFVFDKADVYAGGPGHFTQFEDPNGFTEEPAVTRDKKLNTEFIAEDFGGLFQVGNQIVGVLRLSALVASSNPNSSTPTPVYLGGYAFALGQPWFDREPFRNFEPQEGEPRNKGIEGNDARLETVTYRNGSLWTSHTVWLPVTFDKNGNLNPPTRSAAQWWQINPTNVDNNGFAQVQQFGRVDDPTGQVDYAFPSMAVNEHNDLLLGYSRFSKNQFASGNYSFHFHKDPPNTMRMDQLLKAGEDPYFEDFGSGRNRWGDFSATVVDPMNDLDMWTIQEYAATPGQFFFPPAGSITIDRWGTWWGRVVVQGQTF